MSKIDHIILYLLLFIVYFIFSKLYSQENNSKKFWMITVIPIALYSFVVGSRYGWGPDYISYKYRLEHAFTYFEEQIGFRWLNQGISIVGLNFVGGYIVYSLIFSICAFILIRSYGKPSKYMYILFIPATLFITSATIRQGVAYSFVLLAIYFLNNKQWIWVFIATLIANSIHTASLISILIIGIFYILPKKPISWKITIPLYLFFTFIFDVKKVGFLANYMQYIYLNNKFQSYIENADYWFGTESAEDKYAQELIPLIMSSLFYINLIYFGYWAIKIRQNKNVVYLYNSLVFGIVLYRVVFLFEILRRLAEPLVDFYFIILGYIIFVFSNTKNKYNNKSINQSIYSNNTSFYVLKKNIIANQYSIMNKKTNQKTKNKIEYYYIIGLGLILLYLVLFWGRFVFFNPKALFFWNK